MAIPTVKAEGASPQPLDLETLRRALGILGDPEHGIELRCKLPDSPHGKRGAWSRAHASQDTEAIIKTAQEMNERASAIWFSLNVIPADLGHDSRIADIITRRWLLIDCDPTRAVKECSANQQEHDAAQQTALAIYEDLLALGWPAPLIVDSGNGWHLYYRVDLPTDKMVTSAFKRFLSNLSDGYGSGAVTIDTSVGNLNRHGKLPGTWARKGPNSEERPHRPVRLVFVPETIECLSWELLILQAGPEPTPRTPTKPPYQPFKVKAGASGKSARAYGKAALDAERARVMMAQTFRNNQLNSSAFSLYQLVAGGVLKECEVEEAMRSAALLTGLGEREIDSTLASAKKAGFEKPRGAPESGFSPSSNGIPPGGGTPPHENNGHATHQTAEQPSWRVQLDDNVLAEGSAQEVFSQARKLGDSEDPNRQVIHIASIGRLLETEFPPPVWLVPGIMSEGLNVLAGAPKAGKSLFALNLALTVAGGGMALGKVRVVSTDTLYLSLEDKQRRVKARSLMMLKKIQPTLTEEIGRRLFIATDWPRQDAGGMEIIDLWCQKAERPGLVIVDVWNRFGPLQEDHGSSYTQDAIHMSELKRFGEKRGLTVLVIHHTRKPSVHKDPDDFVNEVSGTLGLTGAADGIMVLMRSRKEAQASLHITGRDVPEAELVLEFDPSTLTWESSGTIDEHISGKVRQKVVGYLKGLNGGSAFCLDISRSIEEKEGSVRQALYRLFKERIVRRVGNAWAYPGEGKTVEDADIGTF